MPDFSGAGVSGFVSAAGAEGGRAERPEGVRAPILEAEGASASSEREGEARGSAMSAENWAEALELAESPEALDRPSMALEAASWTEANAAAVARTGFGAAADLEAAGRTGLKAEGTAETATDGAALRETGVIKGAAEGAEREGDNDNNERGVVPRTGVPAGEALELAPAAPDIPDADGTEM
jgi:hypothetical protein